MARLRDLGGDLAGLPEPLPPLERGDIWAIQLEPLAIDPLGGEALVPVGLDPGGVVGLDHVNLARVERQLDGELSSSPAKGIRPPDLVPAPRSLEQVDGAEGDGRDLGAGWLLGEMPLCTEGEDVLVSGVRLCIAEEAREETAIRTEPFPDFLAGERGVWCRLTTRSPDVGMAPISRASLTR